MNHETKGETRKNIFQASPLLFQQPISVERFIASISIWEFTMMAAKRRIDLTISPLKWISKTIEPTGITVVELSPEIATESCNLPAEFHKDPGDRMIVAAARIKNLTLIIKDRKILDYPHVKTVW